MDRVVKCSTVINENLNNDSFLILDKSKPPGLYINPVTFSGFMCTLIIILIIEIKPSNPVLLCGFQLHGRSPYPVYNKSLQFSKNKKADHLGPAFFTNYT